MKRRGLGSSPGFTVVELLVTILCVFFVLALVVTVLLPPQGMAHERANRVKCASNLRQIGQGLMLYANDNRGWYPRVRYNPTAPLTCFTKEASTHPFMDDGPDINDVTAAMFLLVRNCDLNPEVFVCPSSNQDKDTLGGATASLRCNFTNNPSTGSTLSYSFANMYPNATAVKFEYKFNSGVVADFVIAADRNECQNRAACTDWNVATTEQVMAMNTLNHDSQGQNVMFNDGHVEWCATPFVGFEHDHIYTQQNKTIPTTNPADDGQVPTAAKSSCSSGAVGDAQPQSRYDTVLLPYWDKGQPGPRK